jgi:hypothetical protein
MPRALELVAAVLLVVGACQSQSPPTARPTASPTPSPTPLLVLRAPGDAILADADVGLPRTAARDHLGAAEAARDTANEVLALEVYSGWGWIEASTRTWSGGGRQASETVLLTVRPEAAARAFDYWAADAARAPLSAGGCPAALAGLDQCRLGVAGDRALVVGRLGAEVFRLDVTGLDASALAARQAARMQGG